MLEKALDKFIVLKRKVQNSNVNTRGTIFQMSVKFIAYAAKNQIKWGGATVRCEPGPSDLQLSTIPVCEYCCQEWKGPTILGRIRTASLRKHFFMTRITLEGFVNSSQEAVPVKIIFFFFFKLRWHR